MWTALIILLLTYLFIALQKIPRIKIDMPSGSLIGAVLMILSGVLTLQQAYDALDMDTLLLLLGMMIVVAHLGIAGFFEWVAVKIVSIAKGPLQLLTLLIFTSGILSAFFLNDTICLLFTPILLHTLKLLNLNPLPYLIALATSSNIGSVMSVTGNPQNIYIGSHSGIPYLKFMSALAPISLVGLIMNIGVVAWIYRKDILMAQTPRALEAVRPALDRPLLAKSLIVGLGMLIGFVTGAPYALVAISGAAVLFLIGNRDPEFAFRKVDWTLLLFFSGLFVVMSGVEHSGLVDLLLAHVHEALSGTHASMIWQITWSSVFLSNLVSNVPAVILFKPFLTRLPNADWAWLTLAMSSTLAGNLTLIGSVANLIVVQQARKEVEITFREYLKVGIPLTLLTLAAGVGILLLETTLFGQR